MAEEEKFQVRNLFNEKVVEHIALAIKSNFNTFDTHGFQNYINPRLKEYSFQDRRKLIADALAEFLPHDFEQAVSILLKSLPPKVSKADFDVSRIGVTCMSLFIANKGLNHFETSMNAFYEMTQRASSEFDVRPFIDKYPEKSIALLNEWAQDKNLHVRRLASECCRPRLPWSIQLKKFITDPTPVLQILENLKEDPEEYVRRSVANNLNDISKDFPDTVINTLKSWQSIDNPGTQWIINHAVRTLIKKGHSDALALMGYPKDINITVSPINLSTDKLTFGDTLLFESTITSNSTKKEKLLIDYIIYYMKANGKLSPKVYKLIQTEIEPNQTISINAKRPFKKMTTRTFYAGNHEIALQINGNKFGTTCFELIL